MSAHLMDLGVERPLNPPEPLGNEEATWKQAQQEIDAEADTAAFWALFEDVDIPGLDTRSLEDQLKAAYPRSTIRHPLHDIAVRYVEWMVERRYEELMQ